ncbi:alpha/beta fold hydrolase [Streptomyces sp. SAJ15]|uniref:alpha/beta fold hydrolase n=1 Tax=Streptomyces sp. SAJ15 TaxID=2011095 RepID=UPI001186AC1D|nr:alpha/beta hydrolase [Streptomyces sp. SAJ15]TVL90842.1 alpha/beta hydrolase [Streptomyces sp. SAJ15]
MRLHTREWGTGDRIALLVHGLMSDHRTWHRVAPALVDRGYRVIGVDLRGHGASERGEYRIELFADDLVETLPTGAEFALGHSIGALSLSLAADRLRPTRAVYADPAWAFDRSTQMLDPTIFAQIKTVSRRLLWSFNPRWDEADVDIEVATLADWDPATVHTLPLSERTDWTPERPVVPSLVLAADPSRLVSEGLKKELASRGFEVRTVLGAGHTLHRDDFDGFMEALDGWA